MKVRFPIIWKETEPLEEDEQLSLRALGKSPEIIEELSSVVIETDELSSWYANDDTTMVCLKSGRSYNLQIDEFSFSLVWTDISNEAIKSVEYTKREVTEDDEDGLD